MDNTTIYDTIDSFASLQPGWDGHDGKVIAYTVREGAKYLAYKLCLVPGMSDDVRAHPSGNGSILLSFRLARWNHFDCTLPIEIVIGPEEEPHE